MYLIMKANFDSEFGGDGPELMFIESDKQDSSKFDFLDRCAAQTKRALEIADTNLPKPVKLVFHNYDPTWLQYDDRMEECDFWNTLQEKEAVLVESLPDFFNEDDLGIRQDLTRLEVSPALVNSKDDDRQEIRYTSIIKHTNTEMWTGYINPDEIARLPVFEGRFLGEEIPGEPPAKPVQNTRARSSYPGC